MIGAAINPDHKRVSAEGRLRADAANRRLSGELEPTTHTNHEFAGIQLAGSVAIVAAVEEIGGDHTSPVIQQT